MAMFVDQLRQVLRRLGRAPMFTVITLFTLAIAVGASVIVVLVALFLWAAFNGLHAGQNILLTPLFERVAAGILNSRRRGQKTKRVDARIDQR